MDDKKAILSEKKTVLKLSKEYDFEGEKVSEVDFSGIVNMCGKDMVKIDRILVASGNIALNSEGSLAYSLVFASECTGMPVEFFEGLCPNDAIRVKNVVTSFLNGQDLEQILQRF